MQKAPWDLEKHKADIVISYASRMLGRGQKSDGPDEIWILTNALLSRGFKVWVAPMTPTGENRDDYFFGKIATCKAFLALYSKAYLESDKCMEELYEAFTHKSLPKICLLRFEQGVTLPQHFLGNDTRKARNRADNANRHIGQVYPAPGKCFQDDWGAHFEHLCQELKTLYP
jgi:hypothetical protein